MGRPSIKPILRSSAAMKFLNPGSWVLLNYLMDSRTGLGRFREFRISNYQLMMELIDCCRKQTIDEIIALPDVQERVNLYYEHAEQFKTTSNRLFQCL